MPIASVARPPFRKERTAPAASDTPPPTASRQPLRRQLVTFAAWLLLAGLLFAGQRTAATAATPQAAPATAPAVALFYGAEPPLDELKAFDIAVVDPDHGSDPRQFARPDSSLFAYVSVGEVHPSRPWFRELPAAWLGPPNPAWGSLLIDQSAPGWPAFVADKVIAPLWARGFRGFFLDTLDSYRLLPGHLPAAQQQGLVTVIKTLRARFPGIRLIANRGFELLPAIHDQLLMVAAESLYQGYDAASNRYRPVPEADRRELLDTLTAVRRDYGLPILAIDYVPPAERPLARETAAKIRAAGFIPWVADGALSTLGVGAVEVLPRRVLLVYDSREAPTADSTSAVRYAAMPLEYLGLVPELVDLDAGLPAGSLAGRSAGVVLWLNAPPRAPDQLLHWLRRQRADGVRVVVLGQFALTLDNAARELFGVEPLAAPAPRTPLTVAHRDPMFGFESEPQPELRRLLPLRLRPGTGEALLQLADPTGRRYDAAALTPWGGFALDPFLVSELPGGEQARWVVDPFAFFSRALALPAMPVPDTTTENGRRLFFVHIDGDGYASRAELPGTPLAGRALLEQVLKKHRTPTTLSVIEGEVAPHGLYPALAGEMEEIARESFALPHVEIATHTYSHPFRWREAAGNDGADDQVRPYHLELPGYRFNLQREIAGSADYIQRHLAPAGKPVRLVLWSGDAQPSAAAVREAQANGLLNLNGGNTVITRANPSLTAVAPLGLARGRASPGGPALWQTYAPMMNENVYTNLWTGPFYGFARVVETFELTAAPRRLKPIDLYFHTYSASKRASLNALEKIYAWVAEQPTHPIFASEFVRKVLDYPTWVVAREGAGFRVRGGGELRTLRLPASLGRPDLAGSRGIAGHARGPDGQYVHLTGSSAFLRLGGPPSAAPYLLAANARLEGWEAGKGWLEFTLRGHAPLAITLANAGNCQVTQARPLPAGKPRLRTENALLHIQTDDAAATFQARCHPG